MLVLTDSSKEQKERVRKKFFRVVLNSLLS